MGLIHFNKTTFGIDIYHSEVCGVNTQWRGRILLIRKITNQKLFTKWNGK